MNKKTNTPMKILVLFILIVTFITSLNFVSADYRILGTSTSATTSAFNYEACIGITFNVSNSTDKYILRNITIYVAQAGGSGVTDIFPFVTGLNGTQPNSSILASATSNITSALSLSTSYTLIFNNSLLDKNNNYMFMLIPNNDSGKYYRLGETSGTPNIYFKSNTGQCKFSSWLSGTYSGSYGNFKEMNVIIGFENVTNTPSVLNHPCNVTLEINSTGVAEDFNWTNYYNTVYTEIRAFKNVVQNISLTNTTGIKYINTSLLVNGTYLLYIKNNYLDGNTTYIYSGCNYNICVSDWNRVPNQCIDSMRLIEYEDGNNCPVGYDKPTDEGTFEDCTIQQNIDVEGIIFVFLIILCFICGIIGLFYPITAVIGLMLTIIIWITNQTELGAWIYLSLLAWNFLFGAFGLMRDRD